MDYLFAGIILIGGIFCVIAIWLGWVIFKSPVLFDSAKDGDQFELTEEGQYDIWCQSKAFKINSLGSIRPEIMYKQNGAEVILNKNNIPTHKNGFSSASANLFSFYGYIGNYSVKTVSGSSLSDVQQIASRVLVSKDRAAEPVTFYIKKKTSFWVLFLFIFLAIIGSMMLIFGAVLSIVF